MALDAVLADLAPLEPDVVVCLGDIAAAGPDPVGVIDRIADLGWVTVQGNTDAGMVDVPDWWRDPIAAGLPEAAVPGLEMSAWSADQLSDPHRRYLAELDLMERIDLGMAGALLAFHGSPRSFDDIIGPDTSAEDLNEMLAGADESVLAGGHTHVPLHRRYGEQTILNPGSVGMPFASYGFAGRVDVLPHAAYAVLTIRAGCINVDFRQVALDQAALRSMVNRSDMPHAEWWLDLWRPPPRSEPPHPGGALPVATTD